MHVALEKICADETNLNQIKKIGWVAICVDEESLENWNQSYEILQKSLKNRVKV